MDCRLRPSSAPILVLLVLYHPCLVLVTLLSLPFRFCLPHCYLFVHGLRHRHLVMPSSHRTISRFESDLLIIIFHPVLFCSLLSLSCFFPFFFQGRSRCYGICPAINNLCCTRLSFLYKPPFIASIEPQSATHNYHKAYYYLHMITLPSLPPFNCVSDRDKGIGNSLLFIRWSRMISGYSDKDYNRSTDKSKGERREES